jgi:hypothetical protein
MLRLLLEKYWKKPLHGKRLLWTKYVRVFCDGGSPKFRWLPKVNRMYYSPYWGLKGFRLYLFGREINFSFGVDVRNCHSERTK